MKRGLGAYIIFLKNKVASSLLMLFSGVMMFIAALNGKGNDTKSLPTLITVIGAALTLYATFRLGYKKSNLDRISGDEREVKVAARKMFIAQIIETLVYALVAGVGIFLLVNEQFTNKVLNLMAGGFTTLNGVFGAIYIYKNRENKDFRWKLTIVLTVLELILGPYFIFGSDNIGINGYIIMGALTTVAGVIEVISATTKEGLKATLNDGKEIVHIIKDDKKPEKTV